VLCIDEEVKYPNVTLLTNALVTRALPLVRQMLGSFGHLGQWNVRGLKFGHLALNLPIWFQDQLLIIAVRCQ
jgi:hypothetical protein